MPADLPPATQHSPRVIAVMNQKGGVGKTTTTVHLAAALAAAGRPTLLIDLDPQAHATLHLGVTTGDEHASVYQLLTDESASPEQTILHVRPNLWLMPSQVDLAAAESELAGMPHRELRLALSLAPILSRFEFVLIDCPPALGLLTLNALAAADEVLAPMQAHFLALQGLGKLLETIRMVAADVNPRLRLAGVVLCMHEESTRLSKEVVADLDSFFTPGAPANLNTPWAAAKVYRPAIRRNIKLAECPSFGRTVFEYAPSATAAEDYLALARAIASDPQPRTTRTPGRRQSIPQAQPTQQRDAAGSPRVVVTPHAASDTLAPRA